jgi:hypothetical protein
VKRVKEDPEALGVFLRISEERGYVQPPKPRDMNDVIPEGAGRPPRVRPLSTPPRGGGVTDASAGGEGGTRPSRDLNETLREAHLRSKSRTRVNDRSVRGG